MATASSSAMCSSRSAKLRSRSDVHLWPCRDTRRGEPPLEKASVIRRSSVIETNRGEGGWRWRPRRVSVVAGRAIPARIVGLPLVRVLRIDDERNARGAFDRLLQVC
eukprot:scaffold15453_cov110-Isochrysis_galbana.AAC.4